MTIYGSGSNGTDDDLSDTDLSNGTDNDLSSDTDLSSEPDDSEPIQYWFALIRGIQVGVYGTWYVFHCLSLLISSNEIYISGRKLAPL